MSTELPEPLTPADADLRGLPFMPLDVVRVIDSDLFALSTGDEFKAAVALWCKSWLQVPAGSLPDDPRVLAHLSGAGSRWAKVKTMALRGWVKCTDGRLYHPVVAEKVLDAWERRHAAGEARDKHAEKMRRWRDAKANKNGDGNGGGGGGTKPSRDATRDRHLNGHGDGHVPSLTGTGTGTGLSVTPAAESRTSRDAAPPYSPSNPLPDRPATPLMPRLSDPPDAWFRLADKTEVDDRDSVEKPVVAGHYLDEAARLVAEAAGIGDTDWRPLVAWMRDGIDLHQVILPTIRRLAARPGYKPPRWLSFFDAAVRERRAAWTPALRPSRGADECPETAA